jgi:hypothetical protein
LYAIAPVENTPHSATTSFRIPKSCLIRVKSIRFKESKPKKVAEIECQNSANKFETNCLVAASLLANKRIAIGRRTRFSHLHRGGSRSLDRCGFDSESQPNQPFFC